MPVMTNDPWGELTARYHADETFAAQLIADPCGVLRAYGIAEIGGTPTRDSFDRMDAVVDSAVDTIVHETVQDGSSSRVTLILPRRDSAQPSDTVPASPLAPPDFVGGTAAVYVADLERAVDFYVGVLGLDLVSRQGGFAHVRASRFSIGLHVDGPLSPPPATRGSIGLTLYVDVLEEAIEAFVARGVVFLGPVHEETPVRFVLFNDPEGNALCLAQLK